MLTDKVGNGTKAKQNMIDKEIGEKAGLIYTGKNEEGENEFTGTETEWSEAEKLQEAKEEVVENAINADMLENQSFKHGEEKISDNE